MDELVRVFDLRVEEYEDWFEKNRFAYLSEVEAVKKLWPKVERAVEIGVGTGRFAVPLGISLGIDLSEKMAAVARSQGIEVVIGSAEELPFEDGSLDAILMVVTICFLRDPDQALKEVLRVLRPGGSFVVGIVDKDSFLGQIYLEKKEKSPFYRFARFFSARELISLLETKGFSVERVVQTLFRPLSEIGEVERPQEGYGKGGFVVIKATLKGSEETEKP